MSDNLSWEEFEKIIERLSKAFNPTSAVERNVRLRGRNSETPRQIDVCFTAKIGTEEILVIVECKKHARKIDLESVEAFAGKRRDVGAHIGIMISKEGFSKAAYKAAESENISLYRYRDTLNESWPNGIKTLAFIDIWEITPLGAYFIYSDGSHAPLKEDKEFNFISKHAPNSKGGLARAFRVTWESFSHESKIDGPWAVDCECRDDENENISAIRLEAVSKRVLGYKPGRLHFEGLENEAKCEAKANAVTLLYDGPFTPLDGDQPVPSVGTECMLLTSTFVITSDPRSVSTRKMFYEGYIRIDCNSPVPRRVGLPGKLLDESPYPFPFDYFSRLKCLPSVNVKLLD